MEFKHFVNQLSQIREALSVENKQFTDIHVTGNHIEYTRDTANRESIDIHDLLDVYNVEQHINTTILQNYIKGRKYSPALAILIAAGFYNQQGMRISEEGKETENTESETVNAAIFWLKQKGLKELIALIKKRVLKISWKRLVASAFLIFPVAIILIAIFIYYPDQGISSALIWISIILVIINSAFFLYLIIFKTDRFQEITYTAYFTLMIFNVGIFPLFNYIKDYHERNTQEIIYTAGFRSWGSKVKYYDIKVSYYDKFGNPYSLDSSIVKNPDNWMPRLWKEDNISANVDTNTLVNFVKTKNEFSITIANCGAVLKPKLFDPKAVSFFIDAKIKLLEIDPNYSPKADSLKYHSSQFCLKVPYNIKEKRASDIYYGFEFFFSNISMSKLRIPGLNFDYTFAELYYQNKYNPQNNYAEKIIKNINSEILQRGQKDTIASNSEIHLSALLFDDNAAFYIIKKNSTLSLPLFSFNISKYGAFNLIEK